MVGGRLLPNENRNKRPIVFISHHSSEVDLARRLKAVLQKTGITGWMAPDDISPGAQFDGAIVSQIEQSDAVIVLFSKRSDQSRHVKRELMLAEDNSRQIFPIRLQDIPAQGLAYWLKDYQWIDWLDHQDLTAEKLARSLAAQLEIPPAQPAGEDSRVTNQSAPAAGKRRLGFIAAIAVAAVGVLGFGYFFIGSESEDTLIEPGRYQLSVTYNDIAMPDASSETAAAFETLLTLDQMSHTICFSPEQAVDPSFQMVGAINSGQSGYDCRVTESHHGNGTISLRALCDNPHFDVEQQSRIVVNGTYTRTSYTIDLEVFAHHPEFGRLNITGDVTLNRLGDCS